MAVEDRAVLRAGIFDRANLSPIVGIGPDEIGADALVRYVGGVTEKLALDSTVEGDH